MAISEKVRALKREGKKVIHFGQGDPDFNTPDHIKHAAIKALQENLTHYGDSRGILELREAIAEKLLRENKIEVDPATEIIVTPGGKHAVFCSILALIEPGDGVMFFDPAWVSYEPMVHITEGVPIRVPLHKEKDDFVFSESLLDELSDERTKLFILNSPHNPTGKVFSKKEIEIIASWALKKNAYILTDEVYEKIIFDPHQHWSIAALPGMKERTVTVNAFSKSFAMTGWRLGYLAGPKKVVNRVNKVHQHCATCTCTFIQKAGIAALKGPQEFISEMAREYEKRSNVVVEGLNKIRGIDLVRPQGTFYIFPDISATGLSSLKFGERLLDEVGVAVTPGIGFGESYDDFVRIAYTNSMDEILEALKRMASFFAKIS
jgi:aspartate aminotransferase